MMKLGWSGIFALVWLLSLPFTKVHSVALAGDPRGGAAVSFFQKEAASSAALLPAVFQVAWDPGCGEPPQAARDALLAAAAAWEERLASPVVIAVQACWTSSPSCGGLACGSPGEFLSNFIKAPQVDTAYPVALANALSGMDLNGVSSEINLQFDSAHSWDFSIDPVGNFMTVAMHELGHGLGFYTGMYESYNVGYCGDGLYGALYPCPTVYDRFVVDSLHVPLLSYKAPDPRVLGAKLKSDANFGGPNTLSQNAGAPLPLYTPASFDLGSSICHVDMDYAYTADGLMTPIGAGGLGPLTIALMHDLGWGMADGSPDLRASGPLALGIDQAGEFSVNLNWPAYAGQPITYTWSLPGGMTQVHSSRGVTDTLSWGSSSTGFSPIAVTASGPFQSSSTTHAPIVVEISLSGPTQGVTGEAYAFSAALTPSTGLPVTYTWQVTGLPELIHTGMDYDDTAQFTWSTPGAKTVTVTAALGGGLVAAQGSLQIGGEAQPQRLFLPLVVRR